jgi:5-methyltetrahydrofolate--homocysteine methyltransferase
MKSKLSNWSCFKREGIRLIIVGERINSSRKAIAPAVEARDAQFIQQEALKQIDAGALFIDVNCGTMVEEEPECLEWLVKTVQEATKGGLCSLDSPSPLALERALKVHQGKPLINSITGEKERLEAILPLVRDYKTAIVALAMDDEGMPETAEERLQIAAKLVNHLTKTGVSLADIYLDPMVRPVSTGGHYGRIVFETLMKINQEFPGIHTICGLSNISYGLPARKLINHTFLIMAMMAGLDTAILDPLDKRLMSLLHASEVLLERDEYALNYIAAFRAEKLEF